MKICLIGEFSKLNWVGSATNKVQKYLLKELSGDNDTLLYELPYHSNYFTKLIFPLKIKQTEYGRILSGGIINLIYFLKKEKYDIVHYIVARRFMLYVCLMLWFSSIKKVVTFHDTILLKNRKLNFEWVLKRALISTSNSILVYSDFDKEVISRFCVPGKIFKIKNGVDLLIYRPAKAEVDSEIITFAGGLGKPHKGLHFLEKSLEKVNLPYKLQVCGENPGKLNYKSFIGELNETDFVSQLQKSYIIVVPGDYESFSMAGIEAMSCGTPIIITKNCGLSEYLCDDTGCFIIDPGDEESLAYYINKLLNDRTLREKMSYDARKVAEGFSWEKISKDYLKIYNELLARN